MPAFGDLDGGSNRFGSNYHAMQVKLNKRYSNGLQFMSNYTWGRAMDDQSSLAEWKTQDPYNMRADYSRSSIDLRHIFNFGYVYDLPFGRGRKFGGNWSRALDTVIGGWAIDGFVRAQSGRPWNVTLGQDRANVGRTYQRPNVSRDPNNGPKTPDQWFDTGAFSLPAPFTFGNAGAFIVEGDGRHNWDISLAKRFYTFENQHLEFRGEFFNMWNHVDFEGPNVNFSSTAFGRVTAATAARQIQLALRYQF
jgi:hypothetical protein